MNKHCIVLMLLSWFPLLNMQRIVTSEDFFSVLSQVLEETTQGGLLSTDTIGKLAQLIDALESEQIFLEEHDKNEIMRLLVELSRAGEDGGVLEDELVTRRKIKKIACLLVQQKLLTNSLRVCNDAVFKNIILKEDPAYGTNDITIIASDSVPANYTLTLPTGTGNAEQILSTDGSGALSWITTLTNASQLQLLYTATSNTIPHTLVLRDNLGSFSAQDISAEGNFLLPATTADAGQLKINTTAVLHTNGVANTFVGGNAGNFTLTGTSNIGIGFNASASLVNGNSNVAIGTNALQLVTDGDANVAIGVNTLANNATGNSNVAIGTNALLSHTIGAHNVAIGGQSMSGKISGSSSVAVGVSTLERFVTNNNNVALGNAALRGIVGASTASNSISIGSSSCAGLENSYGNVAIGNNALATALLMTSSHNIAIGQNVALGLVSGEKNIVIGGGTALPSFSGSNNTYIGHNHPGIPASESNRIRFGAANSTFANARCFIRFLGGVADAEDTVTYNTTTGELSVVTSSERYKDNIQDMGDSTNNLSLLRPVTFTYKPEHVGEEDAAKKQYGLIAEEVVHLYPDLISCNAEGQPESFIYQFLAPMLLNECIKQKELITQMSVAQALRSTLIDQLQTRVEFLENYN